MKRTACLMLMLSVVLTSASACGGSSDEKPAGEIAQTSAAAETPAE